MPPSTTLLNGSADSVQKSSHVSPDIARHNIIIRRQIPTVSVSANRLADCRAQEIFAQPLTSLTRSQMSWFVVSFPYFSLIS